MRFLDQFGKAAQQAADAAQQAIDRAKFEADKFQKTSAIQGEVSELQHQLKKKLIELGERAYDLSHTNQLNAAAVADLTRQIDALKQDISGKEAILRKAQEEAPPNPGPSPTAQSVPIQEEAQDSKGPIDPTPYSPPPTFSGQHSPTNQPSPPPPPAPGPRRTGTAPLSSSPLDTPPPSQTARKNCPACGFAMPQYAVFCPNCGFRVGSGPLS